MSDIIAAKQRLPLPALMHRLGLSEHARKSARCPFHDDKRNSFSIWQKEGAWFWKCHAGCGAGDEINFLESHKRISRTDATKLYLETAGMNGCTPHRLRANDKRTLRAFDWRVCVEAFSEKHLERLADWRGLSRSFCSWLRQRGLIGLYDGCIAFPIQDSGSVVASHYRLKDSSWRVYPYGVTMRPLVLGDISSASVVHVFESQWDAFAVADKLALHEKEDVALIVTRGASNGALISGLIPSTATVFVWKQNDELKNGKRAGDEWLKAVTAHAGANVRAVTTPEQFKDVNEWTQAGATLDELDGALDRAEQVAVVEAKLKAVERKHYFDAGRKEYWTSNDRGGWLNLNETQFKRILKQRGISPRVPEGSYVSPLDEWLIQIQQQSDVHYAGALAGYRAGVYEMGERRSACHRIAAPH